MSVRIQGFSTFTQRGKGRTLVDGKLQFNRYRKFIVEVYVRFFGGFNPIERRGVGRSFSIPVPVNEYDVLDDEVSRNLVIEATSNGIRAMDPITEEEFQKLPYLTKQGN